MARRSQLAQRARRETPSHRTACRKPGCGVRARRTSRTPDPGSGARLDAGTSVRGRDPRREYELEVGSRLGPIEKPEKLARRSCQIGVAAPDDGGTLLPPHGGDPASPPPPCPRCAGVSQHAPSFMPAAFSRSVPRTDRVPSVSARRRTAGVPGLTPRAPAGAPRFEPALLVETRDHDERQPAAKFSLALTEPWTGRAPRSPAREARSRARSTEARPPRPPRARASPLA